MQQATARTVHDLLNPKPEGDHSGLRSFLKETISFATGRAPSRACGVQRSKRRACNDAVGQWRRFARSGSISALHPMATVVATGRAVAKTSFDDVV
jgi:hypothetical protein